MLDSYVLRLRPDALAAGRLAGRIEAVATGEQASFDGAEQLLDFCRHGSEEPPRVPPSREPDPAPDPAPRRPVSWRR